MFPFDIDDGEIEVEQEESKEPRDYEIDLKSGKLTGKIITGLSAIEQFISHLRQTVTTTLNIRGTTGQN